MALMILVIVLMFVVFGVVGFITLKKIKETDPNNQDTSAKNNIATAQEFLPFESIKEEGIIDLGQHQYRAIIKCSSINYNLKTDREQQVIEASFQRFLNSLSHPISMYVHTKTMDNTKMLKNLKIDIDESIEDFPKLQEYGNVFFNDMEHIYDEIQNNKEKNKYIIVPYNDAILLTTLTDEEKYEEAIKEIQNRCQIISDGLQSLGIKCETLNSAEIIDLLYSVYHKDTASHAENIYNGDFLKMSVKGEDKLSKVTKDEKLDWILYEAQLRVQSEIYDDKSTDEDIRERADKTIDELNRLRDSLAGAYKTDFNMKDRLEIYK